ncbi:hypothetical protein RDWZM_002510 [Blomia tropicalis]|uniref:Reelin domain-containing protein n=1 Tax=Blomia tropicalis TaxID=40697 RepID=A0A9Q0MDN4_BLOTA|nr:hypothetical protein RDWZM_002510 [Blomia tropicalis]
MIVKSCFIIFSLLSLANRIHSWPSGAPEKTCSTLLPRHGGTPAKEAQEAPYTVEQSASTYQPGDQVKVVLKSPTNTSFKGLLIQAVDPESGKTIGTFSEGKGLKLLDSCSSVTHSDNRNKRSATLVWNAPKSAPGSVIFRATVVQKYDTFYRGLISTLNQNA